MSRTRGKSRAGTDVDREPIELFATAGGIRIVDSPVRVKIVMMLKERATSFEAIVAGTGRAKSTVSVHLNDMIVEGIIGARPDPGDRRKKIFYINSGYLGDLLRDRVLEDDVRELLDRKGVSDAVDFFKVVFRTIRVELYLQGINVDPVLADAGFKVGGALYAHIGSPDLDELLAALGRFWEERRLGRLAVASRAPLTLAVYDCFECADLPLLGRPVCAFDLGMLRGIFYAFYGGECPVEEIECYAMGHDRCCFIVGDAR